MPAYPRMRLCSPMTLAKGRVTIMNSAMTAPEMRPNVQTIFFIGIRVGDDAILPFCVESRVTRSGDFRQTDEKSPVQGSGGLSGQGLGHRLELAVLHQGDLGHRTPTLEHRYDLDGR